jgi:sec-independent protein translocase protein TatA
VTADLEPDPEDTMELFSPGHLIPLLIIVAVVFFGWKQLPDISRSVGRSLHIFKAEVSNLSQTEAPANQPVVAAPVVQAPPVTASTGSVKEAGDSSSLT